MLPSTGPVPNSWTIEEHDGKLDIRLNRRAFAYDCDDIAEARRRIKRSRKYDPDDTVTLIEDDGYRRKVKL